MMKIKALAPNSFKLIPSVTRESGLDLSFRLRHLLALIGGLVLAKKPLTRVYCLSLEHAGDSEAGPPSTEGNWQTGDSCPCHKGPAANHLAKGFGPDGRGDYFSETDRLWSVFGRADFTGRPQRDG